ncbi:phage holin [Pantoea sp. BAV 3049]|uniref:phage holin n=1 Tax=Pantoea sp. BAV 3049 TaxID=2654188 RepID=UPI00131EA885|nr:phage holin [Pantoea sp. BAV 3049]
MSQVASSAAYGASAGTVTVSFLSWYSPDQWSAVGVLAGIAFGITTLGINWYYKRKATIAQIRAYERWPSSAGMPEK